MVDIYVAVAITTITFANSDGCIETEPILNQLVAPFIGSVNRTAINAISLAIF